MITEIIAGTPWWAYLILAVILLRGIQASKRRTVSIYRLLIIPSVLLIFSIYSMTLFMLPAWVFATILGGLLGMRYAPSAKIQNRYELELAGSWSTLGILLCFFCVQYVFGYLSAVEPELMKELSIRIIRVVVKGLVSGFFLGRVVKYMVPILRRG